MTVSPFAVDKVVQAVQDYVVLRRQELLFKIVESSSFESDERIDAKDTLVRELGIVSA